MFDLMSILRGLSTPQQPQQGQPQQPTGMLFQQWNPANQYMPQVGLFGAKPKAPDNYSAGAISGIKTPDGGYQMPAPMPTPARAGGLPGKGGAVGGGG